MTQRNVWKALYVVASTRTRYIAERYRVLLEVSMVLGTIMFLFAGLYKSNIPLFMDWSVFSLGVATISMVLLNQFNFRQIIPVVPTITYFVLVFYLATRTPVLLPWDNFGADKLMRSILFGFPALLLGKQLASNPKTLKLFGFLLLIGAVLVSIYLIIVAITMGNITSTNSFLEGGYQLTGTFVSTAILISIPLVDRKKWELACVGIVICLLGISFIGSVPSFLFIFPAFVLSGFIVILLFGPQISALRVSLAMAVGLIFISLFSFVIAPPAAIYRLVWKAEVAAQEANFQLPDVFSKNFNSTDIFAGKVKLLPQEEQANYVDRVELFRNSFSKFLENPTFGNGFGSFMYKGVRTQHNILIELMDEGGLVALAFFATFVISVLITIFVKPINVNGKRQYGPIMHAVLGVFVFSFLSQLVGGYFVGRNLMFALGLILGVSAFMSQPQQKIL